MNNYVCTFTDRNCIENILKVWLPTLKRNFSGKIVVIVFDVDKEHIELLKKEGVIVIEEDSTISGIGKVVAKRLKAQETFIKTLEDNDKIMLIDGADVVFQSEINSFFNKIDDKIFYSTTGTLTNRVTIIWFKKLFKNRKNPNRLLEKLKNEEIKASGMLAGKKTSFLKYFDKCRETMTKLKVKGFLGINQAVLTYLILKYPNDFKQTYIHNCRVLDKDVVKENGIYLIKKTIPIIHFSCENMKKIYKKSYLSNPIDTSNKKDTLNILWLYGSVPKFDVINHWYHTGFARVIGNMPNVNLLLYGYNMEKVYPDMAKIPFNAQMIGKDLKKLFDFDVIIMDNKNRFAYSRTLKERRAKKARDFWLKPAFFDGLDNIPKIFLEGDYHLHFKMNLPEEKTWYQDRKIDLLLVRHKTALDYHIDKSMPIQWFPCSVNDKIFEPNPNIQRKDKICLISGYGLNYYSYRNTAGKILESLDLIDIYDKRFIGKSYIKNLQSYICHLSGSSIRAITPAKMFEIMASGSLLFTDEGYEYGLRELFPDDSYCTYDKKDYSDVISKAKKIINEPEFRKYTTEKALKCIKEKHTHEIRAKQLIDIITKKFGISYDSGEKRQTLFSKFNDFFLVNKEKILPKDSIVIKTPENIIEKKPEIKKKNKPSNSYKPFIEMKNQEKLKKLLISGVKVCLLEDTCYNIIINKKIGSSLCLGVNEKSITKKILEKNDIVKPIPSETRKIEYKNMILEVPYPIVKYLVNYKGKEVIEMLESKPTKLILENDIYKFIKR